MGNCQNSRSFQSITLKRRSSLEEDDEEMENEIMQFLIVLNTDDFKSPCWLKKKYSTRVKSSGSYLSGILEVVNVNNISRRKKNRHGKNRLMYKINDVVNLKTLYIKLPKENLYVKSDRWQFEYMKSQVREILHIFGLLGAKSVEYSIINSNSNLVNFLSQLNVGNVPVESGLEIKSKNIVSTEISGRTEYQVPSEFPTEQKLYDSNNIYYLARKFDWQDICERRIVSKVTIDNFTYKFNNEISFSAKVTEKFKGLGISFDLNTEETKNFVMNFQVSYYSQEDIVLLGRELLEKISLKDEVNYYSDDDVCYKSRREETEEEHYHSDSEYKSKEDGSLMLSDVGSSFIKKKLKSLSSASLNDINSGDSHSNSLEEAIASLTPTSQKSIGNKIEKIEEVEEEKEQIKEEEQVKEEQDEQVKEEEKEEKE